MPLFILAGGELVLLFIGVRIAWWMLRTRADGAPAAPGPGPTGGGVASGVLPTGGGVVSGVLPTAAGGNAGAESLREAA